MLALALALLSIAQIALAPLALAIAAAVVAWSAVADIEVAIVVSRRSRTGARGQRVIASARTTPRRAVRTTGVAGVVAVRAARAMAAGAAAGAARWTETEQAARWADRARTLADVGPAVGVLCAVWALPWIAITAPDGAAAAAGVCGLLAIVHRMSRAAGLRYRVDG